MDIRKNKDKTDNFVKVLPIYSLAIIIICTLYTNTYRNQVSWHTCIYSYIGVYYNMYVRVNINFVYIQHTHTYTQTQTQPYYIIILYGRRTDWTRRHNAPYDLHRNTGVSVARPKSRSFVYVHGVGIIL